MDSLTLTPTFVNLSSEYKCPVWKVVLKEPQQTPCGHRICRSCTEEYVATHGDPCKCPVNEEFCEDISIINKSMFNDVSVKKQMAKELVYCTYSGCETQVQWKDLQDHINECSSITICQKCNNIVGKSKLHEHQERECPESIIFCQNNCGESFKCKDRESHLQHCSQKTLFCTYKNVGCEFSGKKHAIKEHEEKVHDHLPLVQNATTKNQSQIDKLGKNLSETQLDLDKLKTKVTKTEEETKTLNQDVRKQMKNIQDLQKHTANNGVKILKLEQNTVSQEEMERLKVSVSAIQESQQQLIQNQSQFGRGGGGASQNSLRQHDQQLVVHDVRMAEMDLRFQMLETTNYDGVLIWKIRDYTKRKQDAENGRTLSLYSQPFYTSRYGYKVCGRIYLNGDGSGRGTHMSLFFVVMKSEYDALLKWPFDSKITLMLLDQESGTRHLSVTFRPDPSSSSFRRPVAEMNVASGCPKFVLHGVIDSKYLKDDTIFFKIIVERKQDENRIQTSNSDQNSVSQEERRFRGIGRATQNSSPQDIRQRRSELRDRMLPRTGNSRCYTEELTNYDTFKNTYEEGRRQYFCRNEAKDLGGIEFKQTICLSQHHMVFKFESTSNIQMKLCRHNDEGEEIDITGPVEIPLTVFDIYVENNTILLKCSVVGVL